jgi:hypothetical protein
MAARRAKRENGGLGEDPPGSMMTYYGPPFSPRKEVHIKLSSGDIKLSYAVKQIEFIQGLTGAGRDGEGVPPGMEGHTKPSSGDIMLLKKYCIKWIIKGGGLPDAHGIVSHEDKTEST